MHLLMLIPRGEGPSKGGILTFSKKSCEYPQPWDKHIRLKSFILHIKDPFHQRILRRNVELSQNFMQNLNKLELECRTLCRTFTDNYESNLVVRVHLVDDPQTQ